MHLNVRDSVWIRAVATRWVSAEKRVARAFPGHCGSCFGLLGPEQRKSAAGLFPLLGCFVLLVFPCLVRGGRTRNVLATID
jgi:hypothetical protein